MPHEIMCPGGEVHVVRAGETMYTIARRYGVSLDALVQANPQIEDPSRIDVGQEICIPVIAPECPGFLYEIRRGDTFYELARRYHTTVTALMRYNPDVDPRNLRVGDEICIPVMPPEFRGKRALLLNPTDLTPDADGVALLDFDRNWVAVLVSDVPDPEEFEGMETYKLWLRYRATQEWTSTDMEECDDLWVGKIDLELPLERYDVIMVTAEMFECVERPIGVAVVTGDLGRVYWRR